MEIPVSIVREKLNTYTALTYLFNILTDCNRYLTRAKAGMISGLLEFKTYFNLRLM